MRLCQASCVLTDFFLPKGKNEMLLIYLPGWNILFRTSDNLGCMLRTLAIIIVQEGSKAQADYTW